MPTHVEVSKGLIPEIVPGPISDLSANVTLLNFVCEVVSESAPATAGRIAIK